MVQMLPRALSVLTDDLLIRYLGADRRPRRDRFLERIACSRLTRNVDLISRGFLSGFRRAPSASLGSPSGSSPSLGTGSLPGAGSSYLSGRVARLARRAGLRGIGGVLAGSPAILARVSGRSLAGLASSGLRGLHFRRCNTAQRLPNRAQIRDCLVDVLCRLCRRHLLTQACLDSAELRRRLAEIALLDRLGCGTERSGGRRGGGAFRRTSPGVGRLLKGAGDGCPLFRRQLRQSLLQRRGCAGQRGGVTGGESVAQWTSQLVLLKSVGLGAQVRRLLLPTIWYVLAKILLGARDRGECVWDVLCLAELAGQLAQFLGDPGLVDCRLVCWRRLLFRQFLNLLLSRSNASLFGLLLSKDVQHRVRRQQGNGPDDEENGQNAQIASRQTRPDYARICMSQSCESVSPLEASKRLVSLAQFPGGRDAVGEVRRCVDGTRCSASRQWCEPRGYEPTKPANADKSQGDRNGIGPWRQPRDHQRDDRAECSDAEPPDAPPYRAGETNPSLPRHQATRDGFGRRDRGDHLRSRGIG